MQCTKVLPVHGSQSATQTFQALLPVSILYYFGSTSVVTGFALVFVIGVARLDVYGNYRFPNFPLRGSAAKTTRLSTFLVSNGFGRFTNHQLTITNMNVVTYRKFFYTLSGILIVAFNRRDVVWGFQSRY
jgi:hypothetical protein